MLKELLLKQQETREVLDEKLIQLKKQEEVIQNKKDRIYKKLAENSIRGVVLKPLAKAICERMNIKYYEFYGPFGLNAEISIYFSNYSEKESRSKKMGINQEIDIVHVTTYSLLELEIREDGIYYWDGVTQTNKYEQGSIGYYNNFNHVKKPLPNDLEDIIKVLRYKERK